MPKTTRTRPIPDRLHSGVVLDQMQTLRYEAGLRRRVVRMLSRLNAELRSDLAGSGLMTPRTDWQRARLQKLLAASDAKIAEVYGKVSKEVQDDLRGLVEVSSERSVATINAAVGVDIAAIGTWSDAQVRAIADSYVVQGAQAAEWWERQSVQAKNAFSDQMRMGLLRGETVAQLQTRVLGIGAIASSNAERVVRTAVISVNNQAALETYRRNDDVLDGVEWTATLDQRTCVECGALDGRSWAFDDLPQPPPLHWNCRCALVPKLKPWKDVLSAVGADSAVGQELDQMPMGDRASMAGSVSGDTTFQTWFDAQDRDVKLDILGPGRLEIYERGNLSFRDLLDQRGNELTLAQLRAKR